MNQKKKNILVDVLAFLMLVIITISGAVLWVVLPNGSGFKGGRELADIFLGMARHTWKNIHNYVGLVFSIVMLLHLILHWKWITCIPKMLKNKDPKC